MIRDVLPVGCTWILDVNQFQTALYVAKIFWGMCPRPVISDSLSALKLMCSYLKALAAVRDWNPSHCSAVVCGPSFQVRHTQNQPSNKFICLFPKPKCPKRQRFIYRDWFGKHFLLIPWLVGCWISYPRAGRCQLRSTESHYYRHWRFFSKSQSWGAMTLGCHWVTVWAPMSYLYHPLCTLTPIHWFWWFIRPSMAKFQLCGCPLLPSSLNLASTCYIYIYMYIFNYIHINSIHFISTVQGCPTQDLRAVKGAASVWMLSGLCTKQVEDFAFCHLDLAVGLDGLTMLTIWPSAWTVDEVSGNRSSRKNIAQNSHTQLNSLRRRRRESKTICWKDFCWFEMLPLSTRACLFEEFEKKSWWFSPLLFAKNWTAIW